MSKHWIVVSGLISEVVPVLDDGSGPIEEWREVAYVEADTKREAIVKGLKEPSMDYWCKVQRRDDMNPFTGVTAEPAMCEHGYCWCEIVPDPHPDQDDYCEPCVEPSDDDRAAEDADLKNKMRKEG